MGYGAKLISCIFILLEFSLYMVCKPKEYHNCHRFFIPLMGAQCFMSTCWLFQTTNAWTDILRVLEM